MVHTSKSAGATTSGKSLQRQSKSQDFQIPLGSPSSKSHSSSRTTGSRSHRTRRSSTNAKSSLRETLSSFGDDVIKIKSTPGLHAYDNLGYFQPDISFSLDSSHFENEGDGLKGRSSTSILGRGAIESELAIVMSHDPNFQTKSFERVSPSEVGKRSSKWQKLLQASNSSRKFQKFRKQSGKTRSGNETDSFDSFMQDLYNNEGKVTMDPPFWGVSYRTRNKISFLSLSLILHELACFTSCVLLGCMAFQGMEAISWVQQKPFTENWIIFKWYSSFQTILVVITCLGFLNRVDTRELRSLWMLPLFLIPVLGLSVSDYCNKVWELQRLECLNYFRLDEVSKQKVHLSPGQDCSTALITMMISNQSSSGTPSTVTEMDARGMAPMIMRILATLSIFVISIHLFCCRKNFFLIDLLGPPKEVQWKECRNNSNDLISKTSNFQQTAESKDSNQDVRVIFKRT